MDALAAAVGSAAAVSQVGSHFMLDGNTYKRGAGLGFQGLDFYVTGLQAVWDGAEERTNLAIAHAYEGLDAGERAELVELTGALHEATSR